jgi:Zn-dependent alcohol dehydrogenase
VQGSLFGSCNPFRDIPALLRLHEEGRLELDRLITRRYPLAELNQGYRDQAAGETIRGLLVHGDTPADLTAGFGATARA